MAGSVNKVILIGNLGRDPEVRSTQDGMKIVQLSVATSESWKDKASGERKDKTEWHRVVIFNERLHVCPCPRAERDADVSIGTPPVIDMNTAPEA